MKTLTFDEELGNWGYDLDDLFVTDAYRSECGRFDVDPREHGLTLDEAYALAYANLGLALYGDES